MKEGGLSSKDIAAHARRERDTAANNLRASLDDLAAMWRLASR